MVSGAHERRPALFSPAEASESVSWISSSSGRSSGIEGQRPLNQCRHRFWDGLSRPRKHSNHGAADHRVLTCTLDSRARWALPTEKMHQHCADAIGARCSRSARSSRRIPRWRGGRLLPLRSRGTRPI